MKIKDMQYIHLTAIGIDNIEVKDINEYIEYINTFTGRFDDMEVKDFKKLKYLKEKLKI